MSYLRHGAGGTDGVTSGRDQPRAGRDVQTFLVVSRTGVGRIYTRHGTYDSRTPSTACDPGPSIVLASTHACDPGRPVGRMAVFSTGMAVDCQSQPEHVHPDCPRHRDGIRL